MLPGLRTLLVAIFVTPIVATYVAAALMRAPGESPTHAMAVPQVEHPLAQETPIANHKEQSRMLGYGPATDVPNSTPGTRIADGGSSTYAKTRLGPDTADSGVRGSKQAPARDETTADSSTQSIDPAVTGSVNVASNATAEPSLPHPAVVAVQNQEARKRRITFRGTSLARSIWHAHDFRPRAVSWRRIRVSTDRRNSSF